MQPSRTRRKLLRSCLSLRSKKMPRQRGRAGASRDIPVGLRPTLTIYTCWLTRTLHGLDKILDGSASDAARWSLPGTTLNLVLSTGDPRTERRLERTMSDEFDGQDATGQAGIRATLNRCRALASKIAN